MKSDKKFYLLGVRIDSISAEQFRLEVKSAWQQNQRLIVCTPNPEMLVLAKRDSSFRDILNNADINLADGFGLVLAARLWWRRLQRLTGVEALEILADLCAQSGQTLLLLGGLNDNAAAAAAVLNRRLKTSRVVAESGGEIRWFNGSWIFDKILLEKIKKNKPDVLAVGLGHGKQERWIHDFLSEFPELKVVIGVGGALDFLSGRVARAPFFMRQLGLEWLFRFFKEPRRWRRILRAILVFPRLIICSKIRDIL